jgi:folate-binding protein YgfZ
MPKTTLSNRAVIRVSGEGVRDFLQGLVTNDVLALSPERPVWAGLLTAQGKALFDFILWADGDDVLLDCEGSRADDLARRLTLYRLRLPIAIAREEGLAVHWTAEGAEGVGDPRLAALGRRWIAAPEGEAEGYDARRIALGVPEGAAELGVDKTLWLEANAEELNGVSFSKGCYVGQENTARMHHRDKVRRRLLPVKIAGDPGDETELRTTDGKAAGELRSRVGDIGMAWLRVEHAEGVLAIGNAEAEVIWPQWLD